MCLIDQPYHLAAEAFAVGIGKTRSLAPCKYGNNTRLDSDCPTSCLALIVTVWGDCYCNEPTFIPPPNMLVDDVVEGLSVRNMFELLATPIKFKGASCRTWLSQKERNWKCGTKRR